MYNTKKDKIKYNLKRFRLYLIDLLQNLNEHSYAYPVIVVVIGMLFLVVPLIYFGMSVNSSIYSNKNQSHLVSSLLLIRISLYLILLYFTSILIWKFMEIVKFM